MNTLLTPAEVCELLKVSRAWLRDHSTRRQPIVPSLKMGDLRRYRAEDIVQFVEDCRAFTKKGMAA